jgi:exodeoxyribonuclease VIII
MESGIYDITNTEYHSARGISRSGIAEIKKSPLHYWDAYINSEKPERKKSDEMNLGSAVHCLVLEPHKFMDEFCIMEKFNARTKEGRNYKSLFLLQNEGKITLKQEQYELAERMSESVKRHKYASRLLEGNFSVEQSFFWADEETNVLCKARPDLWHHDLNVICDLKTSNNPVPNEFSKTIKENCYHIQAAMQVDAVLKTTGQTIDSFCFIVVPNVRPFVPYIYIIGDEVIAMGRREYKDALKIYKVCNEKNRWDLERQEVIGLNLPEWALRANSFSMLTEIYKCHQI